MVRVPDGWPFATRAGGWPRGMRAGTVRAPHVDRRVLPRSTPVHGYVNRVSTPIDDGTGQAVITAGAATVKVGPSGFGVRWYPVQAIISTTTGVADASTCQFFKGVISASSQIGGQSYAGGGDTIGLAGMELQPGEFVYAVWSGGNNGDVATLRVIGAKSSLVEA